MAASFTLLQHSECIFSGRHLEKPIAARGRFFTRPTLIGLMLFIGPVTVNFMMPVAKAEGFDNLQIDTAQCALVVSGSRNQDVVFRGEKRFEHCSISVSVDEFNKRYSYCALSGVLATKGRVLCEFGYSDRERSRVFFMSGPDQLCEFVCVRR